MVFFIWSCCSCIARICCCCSCTKTSRAPSPELAGPCEAERLELSRKPPAGKSNALLDVWTSVAAAAGGARMLPPNCGTEAEAGHAGSRADHAECAEDSADTWGPEAGMLRMRLGVTRPEAQAGVTDDVALADRPEAAGDGERARFALRVDAGSGPAKGVEPGVATAVGRCPGMRASAADCAVRCWTAGGPGGVAAGPEIGAAAGAETVPGGCVQLLLDSSGAVAVGGGTTDVAGTRAGPTAFAPAHGASDTGTGSTGRTAAATCGEVEAAGGPPYVVGSSSSFFSG